MDDTDDEAWRETIKGMKRLEKPNHIAKPIPSIKGALSKIKPVSVPPHFPSHFSPVDSRPINSKLRRGKLPVEGRLDMHGMTQAQAENALRRFIEQAFAQEKRSLLVITGKGRKPDGTLGVLRSQLPIWLNSEPLRRYILTYTTAALDTGGEGAIHIWLRKVRE